MNWEDFILFAIFFAIFGFCLVMAVISYIDFEEKQELCKAKGYSKLLNHENSNYYECEKYVRSPTGGYVKETKIFKKNKGGVQ